MENTLRKHILFSGASDVIEICQPLRSIGIEGFIYMRHYPNGDFIDLSNQVKWSEFFLSRYFAQKYPLNALERHMLLKEGVNLWTLEGDNVIWQEGSQHFGFGNGITLCKTYNAYKEIVCFYADNNDTFMSQFYLNHVDLLITFVKYFKEKAKRLIRTGEQNKLHNPQFYLSALTKQAKKQPSIAEKQVANQFLTTIDQQSNLEITSPQHDLTVRELDCVQACTEGKSAKEIAEALYISERTVEAHLSNAKKKLNCRNTTQLVFKATRLFPFELI